MPEVVVAAFTYIILMCKTCSCCVFLDLTDTAEVTEPALGQPAELSCAPRAGAPGS